MSNYFKFLIIIYINLILCTTFAWAVSKSDSKYTGTALMYEFSKHIGFNLHWAKKCNLGGKFEISDEVATLSWEDFKAFNSGWGRMISARSAGCDKDSINDY